MRPVTMPPSSAAPPRRQSVMDSPPSPFPLPSHTIEQLKAWIAEHQTTADERSQREAEGSTVKRNKAFYERQVRRIQQRRAGPQRLQQRSSSEDSDDSDESASLVLRSAPRRRSAHRTLSPGSSSGATASATTADSDSSAVSGRKRKRPSSTRSSSTGSKKRPTNSASAVNREGGHDRVNGARERPDDTKMEEERLSHSPLSPPVRAPTPLRPRPSLSSSPLSTKSSAAYVDPMLLDHAPPPARAAASSLSPINVFQSEQHAAHNDSRQPVSSSSSRPELSVASANKPASDTRPALPPAAHASPVARRQTLSTTGTPSPFRPQTGPSSVTGVRQRLSSLIPATISLFNGSQPSPAPKSSSSPQPLPLPLQRQQSNEELKKSRQAEEETRRRLAAVQSQLEHERRAKEEAESERRRLAEQLQRIEADRKRQLENERRAQSPPASRDDTRAKRVALLASQNAAAANGANTDRDELGALKLPTGFFARLSSSCRRATTFVLRLLAVMTALLLLLVALQSWPVRRLLGLERDTTFCPSVGGPSSLDRSYEGALVRVDSRASCTPCPAHGWCDELGHLQCERAYVRQGSLCVKDTAWMHRALDLKAQALTLLRDQLGRYECGQSEQRGLTGAELLDSIKFASWWARAVPSASLPSEAHKKEALEQFSHAMQLIEHDTQAVNVTRAPHREADVLTSFYAALKDGNHPPLCSLRLTAWQNKGKLLLFGLLWCAGSYLYFLAQRWLWKRRARPLLRKLVIGALQSRAPEAVAVDHLRDELWHDQDGAVWERVKDDIDVDSRVQPAKTRFGHIARDSWLWVGPVPGSSGGGNRSDGTHGSPRQPARSGTMQPRSLRLNSTLQADTATTPSKNTSSAASRLWPTCCLRLPTPRSLNTISILRQ